MSYRRADLRFSAQTRRLIRDYFDGQGFTEVQPQCLQSETIIDPYIDPIGVDVRSEGAVRRQYLQTSPEMVMKQMLADGSGSIYSIGPVFRDDESGPHHRTEFTMLEWYEEGADKFAGIETLRQFSIRMLAGDCDVISYREAFVQEVGWDPLDVDVDRIIQTIETFDEADRGVARSMAADRDGLLDLVLSRQIQPTLMSPTIVFDYPLSQAALAKPSSDDSQCAARFEWFAAGVELGNGYDELLDADEFQLRMDNANQKRVAAGRAELPLPETLATSLKSGIPQSAGVAVGVDRLEMVRRGRDRLIGTR